MSAHVNQTLSPTLQFTMSSIQTKSFHIGGGVLGIEAANAAAATARFDSVVLFHNHNRSAGSIGESRIVRPDYPAEPFMRFALQVWSIWQRNSNYSRFVSLNRGRYMTYSNGYSEILKSIDATRELFGKPPCVEVSSEDIKKVFGSRGNIDDLFGEDTKHIYSPDDFAVDWNRYMKSRFEVAVRRAVNIKEEIVTGLEIVEGNITGIRTQTKDSRMKFYEVASTDTCTIATGAWSQACCRKWHVDIPEWHQPVPVAIISFEVQLSTSQLKAVVPFIYSMIGICKPICPFQFYRLIR